MQTQCPAPNRQGTCAWPTAAQRRSLVLPSRCPSTSAVEIPVTKSSRISTALVGGHQLGRSSTVFFEQRGINQAQVPWPWALEFAFALPRYPVLTLAQWHYYAQAAAACSKCHQRMEFVRPSGGATQALPQYSISSSSPRPGLGRGFAYRVGLPAPIPCLDEVNRMALVLLGRTTTRLMAKTHDMALQIIPH